MSRPRCYICRLFHERDDRRRELGWRTFDTGTAHISYCDPRLRWIDSQCGLITEPRPHLVERPHILPKYRETVRTCKHCSAWVRKKNRQSEEARA